MSSRVACTHHMGFHMQVVLQDCCYNSSPCFHFYSVSAQLENRATVQRYTCCRIGITWCLNFELKKSKVFLIYAFLCSQCQKSQLSMTRDVPTWARCPQPPPLEFVHTLPRCAVQACFNLQQHLCYGQIIQNNEVFQQLGNAEILFCEVLCQSLFACVSLRLVNAMAGSSSRFLPMGPILNGRSISGVNKKSLCVIWFL